MIWIEICMLHGYGKWFSFLCAYWIFCILIHFLIACNILCIRIEKWYEMRCRKLWSRLSRSGAFPEATRNKSSICVALLTRDAWITSIVESDLVYVVAQKRRHGGRCVAVLIKFRKFSSLAGKGSGESV